MMFHDLEYTVLSKLPKVTKNIPNNSYYITSDYCSELSLQVCNPAYLVPDLSQDKLGGLRQEGHPAKKWGDDGGGGIDGPDRVASSQIVGALACIIFPMPHKIQNYDRLPQQNVSGVSG